jgi:ATP-dependent DNA helicase DinG
LRIRRAELVKDNVTLPIQRLREAVSELIKTSDDKDIGQELIECNRRLGELKVEVAEFLSQQADDHVYWVERGGKIHRNLALNAAPVDVADFLRQRLFETDTSIIMTSATLATSSPKSEVRSQKSEVAAENFKRAGRSENSSANSGLNYFIRRAADEIVHR